MNYSTLENFYQIVHGIVHHQKSYSLTELENMIIFERDLFLTMIMNQARE